MRRIIMSTLTLLALSLLPRAASAHELCFNQATEYCLNDPFADYWEENGALPVFGYPISAATAQSDHSLQWTERHRLEAWPANANTPYEVQLGLIGKERLALLNRQPEAPESGPIDGCLWFAETGHNVCDQTSSAGFKQYWQNHGLAVPGLDRYARSLQLFGLPLTTPQMETNANGDTVMTQWFERARFEWHPNNPDEFKVLLGLLGKEVFQPIIEPQPTPIPTPIPTPEPQRCTAVFPAPSVISLAETCVAGGSLFAVSGKFEPNQTMFAYVTQPNGEVITFPVVIGNSRSQTDGTFSLVGALPANAKPGVYGITVEGGRSSGVAYFELYTPAQTPTTDYGVVPASSPNGYAYPDTGPIGQVFHYGAYGFEQNSIVSVYITAPNGSISTARFKVTVDGDGNAGRDVAFRTNNLDLVGIYAITFETTDQQYKVTIYHRITL
ncbi:hypothetical protein Hgul01_04326 [Herpetosiphon gulosus]|uniref:Uncharacterized protein n=2 Tax=Herpetosiphon gulosus TaxID=1973496 RepID=A0ABP9X524_9CHLR